MEAHANEHFPQFPRLPVELRILVWICCIPRRIVDMHDILYGRYPEMQLCLTRTVLCQRPLIARICRESRQVALARGQVQRMAIGGTCAWFDTRTDIIIIQADFSERFVVHGKGGVRGRGVAPGLQALAFTSSDIPLSIDSRLIELDHIFGDHMKGMLLSRWAVHCMVKRRRCTVVLHEISIHMTHQQAVSSGLFGLFGEETTAYFDVHDTRQTDRLLDAYGRARSPMGWGKNWDVSQMRGYLTDGKVHEHIESTLHCLKTIWLKENRLVDGAYDPAKLTAEQVEKLDTKLVLEQLPQLTFVIAVCLCELTHKD